MSYRFLRDTACPLALLVPLCASALAATSEQEGCFFDLRAGVTRAPSPEVSEETNGSGSGKAVYDWKGGKSLGYEFTLGCVAGHLAKSGGMVFGAQLAYAQYDMSPALFRRNDGTTFVPAGFGLRNRTAGVDIMAGYGWASSRNPDDFAVYLEATPLLGGGGAWADTEGLNLAGQRVKESGVGYYYEYGVRGGLYFTERHFIVGVTGQYVAGSGQVDIDLPGGGTSKLTLDRDGFGAGLEAGWRF